MVLVLLVEKHCSILTLARGKEILPRAKNTYMQLRWHNGQFNFFFKSKWNVLLVVCTYVFQLNVTTVLILKAVPWKKVSHWKKEHLWESLLGKSTTPITLNRYAHVQSIKAHSYSGTICCNSAFTFSEVWIASFLFGRLKKKHNIMNSFWLRSNHHNREQGAKFQLNGSSVRIQT